MLMLVTTPSILHTKLVEHHVERYYEVQSDRTKLLQRIPLGGEFYRTRFSHCLNLSIDDDLLLLLQTEYGTHVPDTAFGYLNEETFTSFYRNAGVDIPRCFRKTKAIRS